jgi:PAS domain S-box-containing protein
VAQPKITPISNGKARHSILGDVSGMSREAIEALPARPNPSWLGTVGLAAAIGIAYFMAARFGVTLRANTGTSVFWPAAGISVGALIVWGPAARIPVSAGVVVATAVSNLMIGRNTWLAVAFGFVNAGHALLTTGLIERWFGRSLNFGDASKVLGFLVASTIGSAVAAIGATIAVGLIESTGSLLTVWRVWFASCLLGLVTVAPLVVGIAEAVCHWPARRELVEGAVAAAMLVALSALAISLPQGPWSTALPVGLVFPVLLWVAVHCRPAFSAAAGFVVALTVVWSLTFSIGHFGDASVALADRILAAQTIVLTGAVLTLVVAALFADRRRSEVVLLQSKQRLQLALNGAELGAFSADFATGHLECDLRTARMHGHNVPPTTIKDSRRFVHRNDLAHIDAALAKARATGRVWNAEYRVVHPPKHPHAGETRWVAVESSIVLDARGMPTGLLGVTRDITSRKLAEQALEERNVQRELAEKAGRVGSYAYDVDTGRGRISEGYAAIQGFPEGTAEITRTAWLAGVHPEDVERLDVLRSQAFRERKREYNTEYRIVRSGGVRWIETRVFISYDNDGHAQRLIGVNIDVTERKQTEARLADLIAQFDLAHKAARVGCYTYDISARTMRFSRASMASYGLTQSTMEITAQQWFARVHRDDKQRLRAEHIRAFKERRPELINEFRVVRPGGEVRWIEGRSLVVYDHAGRAERMTGVYIDVTERKQTEALLSESKARLTDALAVGQVTAFEWDVVTGRTQRSENAIDILGAAKSPRSDFLSHVHSDDRMTLVTQIRNLCPNDPSYTLSFRYICSDSREVWLEETARGEFDDAGKLLRIKGLTRDITNHKRAELALAERNAQLALAARAVLVGSYTYDVNKGKMLVSEGYAVIHGLPEGTTEASYSEWRARVHPEDLGRAEELRDQAFADQRKEDNAEYRIVLSTGEIRWIERRGSISYGEDGRPKQVVGVNIDVTERKHAERHQRALNAELDHRVKNVLATVSAIIGQTREASRSPVDFAGALNNRIKSLAGTHELLSQSHWRGVPLADIIRRELAPYGMTNTDIGGPDATLKAEATQAVATVLHELTTNAAKYGAFSNQAGRVSVQWQWLNNGSQDRLIIEWQEAGGPPVLAPSQSGYGTSIIRELIPFELGGKVELVFASKGIRCRLEIPADWMSRGGQLTGELGVLGSHMRSAIYRSSDSFRPDR